MYGELLWDRPGYWHCGDTCIWLRLLLPLLDGVPAALEVWLLPLPPSGLFILLLRPAWPSAACLLREEDTPPLAFTWHEEDMSALLLMPHLESTSELPEDALSPLRLCWSLEPLPMWCPGLFSSWMILLRSPKRTKTPLVLTLGDLVYHFWQSGLIKSKIKFILWSLSTSKPMCHAG